MNGRSTNGHSSAQTVHLRLDSIGDDVVSLPGGIHRAVLEVGATNFALQGELEQEALISGFAAFLNSLTFPIQVLVRVLPLDFAGYLADFERRAREELPEELAELARDHALFLRGLARNRALLERRFFVVVPSHGEGTPRRGFHLRTHDEAREPSLVGIRKQLTFRCEEIERGLGRCGLRARRLKSAELAHLLYACWCPELSRVQRLEGDLAEYTALVVSGERNSASEASVGAAG